MTCNGVRARRVALLPAITVLFASRCPTAEPPRAEDKASTATLSAELVAAIRSGAADRVSSLLNGGVPVDVRDAAGNTPLILAALHGTVETVDLLLKRGADANAVNRAGVTPLIRGATDPEKVRRLLAAGAKAAVHTEIGNTPLILAARRQGSATAVRLLLERGSDLKARNKDGTTAILTAAASGDLATVQILLEKGADVNDSPGNQVDFEGMRTPLMWAALHNDLPMVRFLLDHGADPNIGTPFGTPLSHCAWSGSLEAAQLLVDRGARVDVKKDFPGFTPLHWACLSESPGPKLVQLLLARGADPNATGGESIDAFLGEPQTPLLLAQKRGRTAIVAALESAGARLSVSQAVHHPGPSSPPSGETPAPAVVAAAAERAIALLQLTAARSREEYLRHPSKQDCSSCHQQFLPMAAVGHARQRGLRIDDAAAREQIALVEKTGTVSFESNLQATFHPEPAYSYGYGAFGLASEKAPAADGTDIIVHQLATIQAPDGCWHQNLPRPPIQSGDIGSTALAVQAIRTYGWPARRAEFDECIARGRKWLWSARPETTGDAVFQLLGLHWAGEPPERLADLAKALVGTQREDGGWSQLATLGSDAYATGQALYALARAARIPVADGAWQRGLRFLLGTQHEEGCWHVPRRTFPFQPTMPSGFPHGRDSWLSAAATSWAVLALTQAIEPAPPGAARVPAPALPSSGALASRAAKPAGGKVDFVKAIQPILQRSCIGCHGPGRQRSGFRVDSAETIVKGGGSGKAAIVPGHGDRSPLVRYVTGAVEGMEMPPLPQRGRFPALTPEEAKLLRAWIDQGAEWPEGVTLTPKGRTARL